MENNGENRIVGSGVDEHAQLAAEEYWTPERRAAAKPVPLPSVPAERPGEPGAEQAPQTGEPGYVAPGHARPGHRDGQTDGNATLSAGGNPVANPLVYPYVTCGKLFFTQGGNGFAGSAALIGKNVLLTAGHCVYNGGWSGNVSFFPSYPSRPASDPLRSFSSSHLAAWTAWTSSGNRAFDYGMAWIDNNPGDSLSWLGLLWNAVASGRIWDAVGYPATPNPPFNGEVMDEAIGTFVSSSTSGTIGLSNDNMEHGSSGGPWITDFNGSSREYANGLQSFHVNDGDFVEYGPYFTQDVKGLFDWISNPANRTLTVHATI
jgi:hypothetical protein